MLHGISKVEWWVGLLAIVVLKCIKIFHSKKVPVIVCAR